MVIAMVTAMVMLLANTNGYCQTLTGIIMTAMIHSKAIMLQCARYDTNKGGIHDSRSIDTPGTFIRLANDIVALTRRVYNFEFEHFFDRECCTLVFQTFQGFKLSSDSWRLSGRVIDNLGIIKLRIWAMIVVCV
jgi:hypothetical protein